MAKSRISLIGLPHRCDVVRRGPSDDGAGGIVEGGTETVLYLRRQCRITTLDAEDRETIQGYGYDSEQVRKSIFVYSPSIQRNDIVKIPYGTPPNVAGAATGLPDGFPVSVLLFLATGSTVITMKWDTDAQIYTDTTGDYTVVWNGTVWVFTDANGGPFVHEFTGWRFTQNIFCLDWTVDVDPEYSIQDATGPVQCHRVVWVKHQIDDKGHFHHTSLVLEIEDNREFEIE